MSVARNPILLPSTKDVLDKPELGDDRFTLAACEADMMQCIAQEQIAGASTPVAYYRLDKQNTTWDALYNEARELVYRSPLNLSGRVQKPEKATQADDKGQTTRWDAVLWLAVKSWPDLKAPPTEGDVVGFWNEPYFRGEGVRREKIPGASFFYDVVMVDTDGHVNDTGVFVAWELTLVRRTEFTPERRTHELATQGPGGSP